MSKLSAACLLVIIAGVVIASAATAPAKPATTPPKTGAKPAGKASCFYVCYKGVDFAKVQAATKALAAQAPIKPVFKQDGKNAGCDYFAILSFPKSAARAAYLTWLTQKAPKNIASVVTSAKAGKRPKGQHAKFSC